MRERWLLWVYALCLVVVSAGDASGQQETATVTGVVRDTGGALLAEATVVVTNVGTGMSVTTRTKPTAFTQFPVSVLARTLWPSSRRGSRAPWMTMTDASCAVPRS